MEFERPDLPCSICGQPGKLRHYPGPVPVSSTYCDEHYALLQRGYDETIDAPYRYFTGPTERDDTDSDVTAFYEFHGEWCVRQVEQFDGNTYKSERDEDWATVCEIPLMEIDLNDPDYPLSEITKADFERVWCAPTTHPQ